VDRAGDIVLVDHALLIVSMAGAEVSTLAGERGFEDGQGGAASFIGPRDVVLMNEGEGSPGGGLRHSRAAGGVGRWRDADARRRASACRPGRFQAGTVGRIRARQRSGRFWVRQSYPLAPQHRAAALLLALP